jgi:hypothetical protein
MATPINYFDRSLVGVISDPAKAFHWSNKDYAAIMVSANWLMVSGYCSWAALLTDLARRQDILFQLLPEHIRDVACSIRPAFSLIGFIVARFGLELASREIFLQPLKQ